MTAFAIKAYGRRFVGINRPPMTDITKGWKPLRWVEDPELAELFEIEEKARAYAGEHLGHDVFEIVAVVPRRPRGNFPTGGGTPVAIAAAA